MTDPHLPVSAPLPAPATNAGSNPFVRIGLGILLMLPAAVCCATQFAWPTLATFLASLQQINGLGNRPDVFVGMSNYAALLNGGGLFAYFGFTAAIAVERGLVVSVVPLLLGLGLSSAAGWPRRILRALTAGGIGLFVPVAVGLVWRQLGSPATGFFETSPLASPGGARSWLLAVDGLYTLGIAAAAGAWLYPMAARSRRGTSLAVFAVLVLAAIASALQTSVLSEIMTAGGPARSTTTLVLAMENFAARQLQFGPGAAVGAILLVLVMGCGLTASLLVVFLRLRLSPAEAEPPAGPSAGSRSVPGLLLLAVGGLVFLASLLASALPMFWVAMQSLGGGDGSRPAGLNLGASLAAGVVPAFISAFLIQLPLSWLAAFAIGSLRPLGKWSEALLLLFGPWLFATWAPFMVVLLRGLAEAKSFGEFRTMLSPLSLSVPLLFVLTLYFKGRGSSSGAPGLARQAAGSLPLALAGTVVLFISHLNEFLWPLLVSGPARGELPLAVAVVRLALTNVRARELAGPVVLLWVPGAVVFALALGVWLLFYGDRLKLDQDR
jgi:ABC-type sugar transport system permease subunit